MIRIGIFGATGYTGLELLKLLGRHPAARIAWLTSENSAGQQLRRRVPRAAGGVGRTHADPVGGGELRERGRGLLPAARRRADARD